MMTGTDEVADERLHADVAVIGYGPVGRLLALLLGRRGKRVVAIERQPQAYPLPRAVHFDDEVGRILQSVGIPPDTITDVVTPYREFYEWRAADRRPLLRMDWRGLGPSGWHVSHFFHQPALEALLDARVELLETVTVLRGWEAETHVEQDDGVRVELRSAADERRTVTARYVVGTDGANSLVRSWIGSALTDLGYFHDWLVVDLLMLAPLEDFDFSPAAWQLCDPQRPTTLVPGGPGRRRFEFMRLPSETADELNDEETTWRLLKPWGITPQTATLERHAVYTFQARWCDTWRKGRLLLAGDAAHLMPPFAGQGMCSGLRDAVNLAWKLELVLDGRADDGILDSYGPERAEHVRHFIQSSMELGEVICLADPAAAAERDRAMQADLAAGVEQPPRPLPRLGAGLRRDDAGGGLLSVQAELDDGTRRGLFDDIVGPGGALLLAAPHLREGLRPQDTALLSDLDWKIVTLDAEPGAGRVVDITGTYTAWLGQFHAVAALIRPDFYVYGTAADAEDLTALLQHLGAALHAPASPSR
ncbi:bifunctional 3-(3-hydroxy-phenyl)propionate/3-hydroxycinnamic acid hydroxylase [Streptomyces sp. NPDC090088]|uniref:bifunctional 3-(3-hydroxy-phenyl)propionate/3-hydroxycinnamic acid hydroxylase MhpA n=1 Tax=Streptomyces sp. NPDC090088 TaxID=3365944 RepID=UPI00382C9907